ncbi:MAG TPA: hypothetical protein VHX38_07350 [Pseudonocardiaceae bacterium]|nr:hypothetical protein [Pseudonocardiaceae bacterium]
MVAYAAPRNDQNLSQTPVTSTDITSAVGKIQSLVSKSFPMANAGVTITSDQKIEIRVTPESVNSVDQAVSQAGLSSLTQVVPEANSLAQLKSLTLQIASDAQAKKIDATHIVRWGPDVNENKVVFYLDTYDAATATQLESHYGANLVDVSKTTEQRGHQTSSRTTDTAPYYGGDAIWVHGDTPGTDCSTGFEVRNNSTGASYELTAGHCAAHGAAIDTNFSSNRTIGTVALQRFVYGGLDTDLITGSFDPLVWTNSGTATVVGSGDVAPGQGSASLITVDGAASGEHRQLPVIENDACVIYEDGVYTCYLTVVSGYQAPGGDSGGPAYQYAGATTVNAVGTIDGEGDNETFVQQISDIENYFNVTTATG